MPKDMRVNQVNKDRDKRGFYPTPAWATRQFLKHETFEGKILEPACGDGKMSRVLEKAGYGVVSKDLYDRGYGKAGQDFLKSSRVYDNIMTNPPYEITESFILHGMDLFRKKMVMIVRFSFLGSQGRYRTIFSRFPPARVYIMAERPSMALKDPITGKRPNAVDYCWLVWDKEHKGASEIRWIAPREDK